LNGRHRTISPACEVEDVISINSAEEQCEVEILIAEGVVPTESKERLRVTDNLSVTFYCTFAGYYTTCRGTEIPSAVFDGEELISVE